MPDDGNGEVPAGDGTGQTSGGLDSVSTTFVATDYIAVIDISGTSVTKNDAEASVDSIWVDDILVIVVGENNEAESVIIQNVSDMGDAPA